MSWKYTLMLFALPFMARGATEVSQYGITWRFDDDYEVGQFCTGDFWVVGPVRIVSISNSWHTHGLTPSSDQDGSMINPPTGNKQGYDERISSYDVSLNAGKKMPLNLRPGSSLVSAVSWLAASKDNAEPGCPRINAGTKTPRPVIRTAAILTCLASAPPEGSFRPPYCGSDKTIRFNKSGLQYARLPSLRPVEETPPLAELEAALERPWIDHVNEYLGAFVHPSENMPQYGADLSKVLGNASLMLVLDFDHMPGHPSKEKLLTRFVQLGIDLTGIADNGGFWPSNGGHHMGRKWPILFAGMMLNDEHMQQVGQWNTAFQEDHDTFYVTKDAVSMTHSEAWKPDTRASRRAYEKEDIGLPEWGIRHTEDPEADNMAWDATYRDINNPAYVGWVLAARIMEQKNAWNHDALFDYIDRATAVGHPKYPQDDSKHGLYVFGSNFVKNMWKTYRADYGPMWTPNDPADFYSPGELKSP